MQAIRVASAGYFISHYRMRGDVFGVLHRMRTWYNQQARHSDKDNDIKAAQRYAQAADAVSARIKEVEEFYA